MNDCENVMIGEECKADALRCDQRMGMSNKVRASRFLLYAVLCLCPLACKRSADHSSEISVILNTQGVLITNSVPSIVCRDITLKQDGNGFTIFVEGGSFADVRSFLEAALGDPGIDLGKDIDGFETAAFHKSPSHPGFLMQAKPNGIELIGIK